MNRFLRRKPRPDSVIPSSRQDGYTSTVVIDPDPMLDLNLASSLTTNKILNKNKQTTSIALDGVVQKTEKH